MAEAAGQMVTIAEAASILGVSRDAWAGLPGLHPAEHPPSSCVCPVR